MIITKARSIDLKCYDDEEFYNKYTLAIESADTKIEAVVNDFMSTLFGGIATIVIFFIMFDIDHFVCLFCIFPIIGNFVFGKLVGKIVYKRNKDSAKYNRRIEYLNRVMYLREYAKEIRLSNVFSLLSKQYDESVEGIRKVCRKGSVKAIFLHVLKSLFTFSFIFEGVLLYGAYRAIISSTISFAVFSVLTGMMVSASLIMIGCANSITSLLTNGMFVRNMKGFMEYVPSIPEGQEGILPDNKIETIEFKNVSFSYNDREIIKNVSFVIEGNKSYAIVGHNGAGKSTLIKLLLRFYDPSEGTILLNGIDIKEYNLRAYRELFATAFQDQRIFSMTIRENVSMYMDESRIENNVEEALKLAGIYDRIKELPNDIESTLTKEFDESGVQLSGGEFQKIAVARAFAKKCPIKIFDEPSSALDPISEGELFESIQENGKNRTLIFVSHRLSSVKNVDSVLVLDDGRLLEEGAHKELLIRDGIYSDMYKKQAEKYMAV
ncbi:MAG: ABC transporter ATP-binding protein/permease [Clostridia bacterium]|nr:ABC transporter ATP-binding protein/permease [Clostridia bacterium]